VQLVRQIYDRRHAQSARRGFPRERVPIPATRHHMHPKPETFPRIHFTAAITHDISAILPRQRPLFCSARRKILNRKLISMRQGHCRPRPMLCVCVFPSFESREGRTTAGSAMILFRTSFTCLARGCHVFSRSVNEIQWMSDVFCSISVRLWKDFLFAGC
jgi:hypothetical protein